MQSSGSEAMTRIFSHKASATQDLDSCHKGPYKLHPAYLQVTLPQTKSFQNIWRKQETKRGHLITSQASWLSASVNAYTLQISVLAICLAITLGIVALDSKSTHTRLFPTILPPELCHLLLCHSSCDLPYSTATHIAVSQGHRSLQLEKKIPISL